MPQTSKAISSPAGPAPFTGVGFAACSPMNFRDFVAATRPELVRPDAVHPADLQSPKVAAALDELAFDIDGYDLAWQDYLTAGGFPRAVFERTTNGAVSDTYLRDLAGWLRTATCTTKVPLN